MIATLPSIGQRVTVRGIDCRIIAVRPAGTIDVSSDCGRHHWRLSGLYLGSAAVAIAASGDSKRRRRKFAP